MIKPDFDEYICDIRCAFKAYFVSVWVIKDNIRCLFAEVQLISMLHSKYTLRATIIKKAPFQIYAACDNHEIWKVGILEDTRPAFYFTDESNM